MMPVPVDLEPALSDLVFVARWTPARISAETPVLHLQPNCLLMGQGDRILEAVSPESPHSHNLSAVFDVGYSRAGGSAEAGRIYLFLNDLADDAESLVLYVTATGPWQDGGTLIWQLLDEAHEAPVAEAELAELNEGHSQIAVHLVRDDESWKMRQINLAAPHRKAEDVLACLLEVA